jgi:hypothetical protein
MKHTPVQGCMIHAVIPGLPVILEDKADVSLWVVLCQEDAKASCCTRDEGRPFGGKRQYIATDELRQFHIPGQQLIEGFVIP